MSNANFISERVLHFVTGRINDASIILDFTCCPELRAFLTDFDRWHRKKYPETTKVYPNTLRGFLLTRPDYVKTVNNYYTKMHQSTQPKLF